MIASIDYRWLSKFYQDKPREAVRHLTESLKSRQLKPTDFSIRGLAESLVPHGREWVQSMNPRSGNFEAIMEAGAVQVSDFSNITGQIIFSAILDAYNGEEFVFSKVVPGIQSEIPGIEKVPGVSAIGDDFEIVDESQPYPMLGVNEDYIEIAEKTKRGGIVPVTKEAVMFDRTGVLLARCGDIGQQFGLNKEKRIIDAIIDENTGATSITAKGHRYHWKGTSYATYQTSTPWINSTASGLSLVDWKSVESAELLLAAITDPYTGEPYLIQPTHLIVTPQLVHTAKRIVTATNIRTHVGGYATSGNLQETEAPNPLDNYTILSSRMLAARLGTDTSWFLGNPSKAFAYFYNWDITPEQVGNTTEINFMRDIVQMFKVSERGCAATMQPRLMCKSAA